MEQETQYDSCFQTISKQMITNGIIYENCPGNLGLSQIVAIKRNNCSVESIHRTFKFWRHCSSKAVSDTVVREQIIYIQSPGLAPKGSVEMPADTIIYVDNVVPGVVDAQNYTTLTNPDVTGWPSVVESQTCFGHEIGYSDKIFDLPNTPGICQKLVRNWFLNSSCHLQQSEIALGHTQFIYLMDTLAPAIELSLPNNLDTVVINSCETTVPVMALLRDNCGLEAFDFAVENRTQDTVYYQDLMQMQFPTRTTDTLLNFHLTLSPGNYILRARLTDLCNSESFEAKSITIYKSDTWSCTRNQHITGNSASMVQRSISHDRFELRQNYPNPFFESTVIEFFIDRPGAVEFKIVSIDGKTILFRRIFAREGSNQISLNQQDFPNRGTFYYQLTAPTGIKTRKMILME